MILHRIEARRQSDQGDLRADPQSLPEHSGTRGVGPKTLGVKAVRQNSPFARAIAQLPVRRLSCEGIANDQIWNRRHAGQQTADQPRRRIVILKVHVGAADIPDHPRAACGFRRKGAYEIGVIQPSLDNMRSRLFQKSSHLHHHTRNVESASHVQRDHRHANLLDPGTQVSLVLQDHHCLPKPTRVHHLKQLRQHGLGAAPAKASDNVNDVDLRHHEYSLSWERLPFIILWYKSTISLDTCSCDMSDSTMRRLSAPKALRRSSLLARRSNASHSASGSPGGTTIAFRPSRAISREPGTSVAISGRAHAAASSSAFGSPSPPVEGSTAISA